MQSDTGLSFRQPPSGNVRWVKESVRRARWRSAPRRPPSGISNRALAGDSPSDRPVGSCGRPTGMHCGVSMSDAGRWMAELRSAARLVALYPDDHPSVDVALMRLVESGSALARAHEGEAVVSMVGDSVYLDRHVLPHESLEHNAN